MTVDLPQITDLIRIYNVLKSLFFRVQYVFIQLKVKTVAFACVCAVNWSCVQASMLVVHLKIRMLTVGQY